MSKKKKKCIEHGCLKMNKSTVIYEQFGKKARVPLNVYLNGKRIDSEEWDVDFWVERPEEWYGLNSPSFKDKRILVIEGDMFRKGIIYE